ncbi:hypothetical protein ACIA8K_37800 [Catenuloplanes sp. NPDC051500]|uniref:hypothetical protein n=1 Tax=Catenuloplanes sp. NPDC051500 TaxID=3363959 RepID=UPI0037882232
MNADDMIGRLSGTLSPGRRLAAVVALLGGLGGALVAGTLWATEPGLPGATRAAFAVMVAVGLGWCGWASWVLTRRAPLFARDRVIAGWLGLTASALLAAFVAAVAISRDTWEPAAIAMSVTLLVVAVVNLVRARAHRAALLRRKRELGG